MKILSFPPARKNIASAALVLVLAIFSVNSLAQQAQLSLADFLIGLRSKKVTLEERNKILTEAAKERGVTFALTSEIEKELEATGANKDLITAIREKGAVIKAAAVVQPKTETVVPTNPPPPDRAFYQKRAAASAAKGDLDSAIADYGKAIEMPDAESSDYLNRGVAFYGKKSYNEALADLSKSIELKPTSIAYLNRGFVQEKLGATEKAMADFQKSVDLDANNESAKLNLKRLQDDQAKALAKAKEAEAAAKPAPVEKTQVIPESVNMGALSAANATNMVTPLYSDVARKSGIEGKVVVEVTLDVEGNVTGTKVVSGPAFLRQSAEDAARRSKFKPATFNGAPVKATGTITYNFTRGGTEE
jgi:TonB family protein